MMAMAMPLGAPGAPALASDNSSDTQRRIAPTGVENAILLQAAAHFARENVLPPWSTQSPLTASPSRRRAPFSECRFPDGRLWRGDESGVVIPLTSNALVTTLTV
jgi:hypothetical protein